MEIKLTEQEAQALGNYLVTKPYAEVFQFVAMLQSKMNDGKKE